MKKLINKIVPSLLILSIIGPLGVHAYGISTSNSMKPGPLENKEMRISSNTLGEILEIPEFTGKKLDEGEGKNIVSKIGTVMANLDSFHISTQFFLSKNEKGPRGEGIIFPMKKEGELSQEVKGENRKLFIKEGRVYSQNNPDNKWFYNEVTLENYFRDIFSIDKALNRKYEVYKKDDKSYFIYHEATYQSNGSSNSINSSNISNTLKREGAIKYLYIVDKDYRILTIYTLSIANKKDNNEEKFRALAKTEISKFNENEPIIFPEELKDAKVLKANPKASSSNTSNSSSSSN